MLKSDMFGWLVRYFCEAKWEVCSKFVTNGVYKDPFDPTFKHGEDENHFHGALLIVNGDKIYKKLVEDKVIAGVKKRQVGAFIAGYDTFKKQMEKWRKKDGAIICDRINSEMIQAGILNQSAKIIADIKYHVDNILPQDYICEDGSVPIYETGARTDIAIKVSTAYEEEMDVDVLTIKETAYNPLSLGLVSLLNRKRLIETFFLRYMPNSDGPWVDEKQRVVGVYRRFVDENGIPSRDSSQRPVPNLEIVVDKHLVDGNGNSIRDYLKESKPPIIIPSPALQYAVLEAK